MDVSLWRWCYLYGVVRTIKRSFGLSDFWLITVLRTLKPLPEIWELAAMDLGRSTRWALSWQAQGVRVTAPNTVFGVEIPSEIPEHLIPPPSPPTIPPVIGNCMTENQTQTPPPVKGSLVIDGELETRLLAMAWVNDETLESTVRNLLIEGVAKQWPGYRKAISRTAQKFGYREDDFLQQLKDGTLPDFLQKLPELPQDVKGVRDDAIIRLWRSGRGKRAIARELGVSVATVRRVVGSLPQR